MARYRKIDPRIWNDEKFRAISSEARQLWLYFLTGPSTNRIGLYGFSASQAAEDIGVPTASIRRRIAEIESKSMAFYSATSRLIWIPNWLKYNSPSGINQAIGIISEVEEFLPHPFARCLHAISSCYLYSSGGKRCPLTKKQAILVRDGCRCVYCCRPIVWSDYELDHIVPKRRDPGDRYDQLVASCKKCNREKSDKSADEFGFPSITGTSYSTQQAVLDLVLDSGLRSDFSKACGGLPPLLAGLDDISHFLDKLRPGITPFGRRENDTGSPFPQEQEQESIKNPPISPPKGGTKTPDNGRPKKRKPGGYKPEFESWWRAYPRAGRCEKAKAAKAYERAKGVIEADDSIPDKPQEHLLGRALAYAASPRVIEGRAVKHAATWLNGGCWADSPEAWQAMDPDSGPEGKPLDQLTPEQREARIAKPEDLEPLATDDPETLPSPETPF